MTWYQRHAQGPVVKAEFTLTRDNLDYYHELSNAMHEEMTRIRHVQALQQRLLDPSKQDELYTPDFIQRRMQKIMNQRPLTARDEQYILLKKRLEEVYNEIKPLLPLCLDEKTDPDVLQRSSARMSELDQLRENLEDQLDNLYGGTGAPYQDLCKNLPKIYYMLLEGVDIETLNSCFSKLKMVLEDRLSTDTAASQLMDETEQRYNMPGVFDPLRSKPKKKKKAT